MLSGWRPEVVRRAASDARVLLREALVGTQEIALQSRDAVLQSRLLVVAERIAEAASELYEIEHHAEPAVTSMRAVRAELSAVLNDLQQQDLDKMATVPAMNAVAQSLAVVFAACGGEVLADDERAVEATVPASRKGLVLVDAADDDALADERGGVSEPSPAPGEERRAADRATLAVDVGFVSESNFYAGLSMDVSVGGLFVATYQRIAVGTDVTLSFVLPDGTTVTTAGQVRWTRDAGREETTPGIGVAFVNLAERDLMAIERFCRKRPPMYVELTEEG